MTYDAESLITIAIDRLKENMMRTDERWNEANVKKVKENRC